MSNTKSPITIRAAEPQEAQYLSDLALRAKGYWGYSEAFLASCADELTLQPQQIADDRMDVVVAEHGGEVVGFYALARDSATRFELHALFVEPAHIGCGIGRRLIEHAIDAVAARSGTALLIQGDPHAEKFYLSAGARQVGSRESGSIPGRLLPMFEIAIQ